MNNFEKIQSLLEKHDKFTIAARFRCMSRDEIGELWQCVDREGKTRIAAKDFWKGRFFGWNWVCDPDGYQERDNDISDDCRILLCDQNWNVIKDAPIESQKGEHYIGWEQQTCQLEKELIESGKILPKDKRTSPRSLLKPKWEDDNMGEQYFENIEYFGWKSYAKPSVFRRFEWAGMHCYILRQRFYHPRYNVDKEVVWVICGTLYWALPHTILSCNAWLNDGSRTSRKEAVHCNPTLKIDAPDRYGNSVNCHGNMNYVNLCAPSIRIYYEFCKANGLRPIIAKCSENYFKCAEIGFDICELRPYTKEMPDGFTPYPMMSNGSPRMGGYKVEDGKLIVWRPNPNYYEPCMSWQEYQEWRKSHVQL